jgi:hypothetical protein
LTKRSIFIGAALRKNDQKDDRCGPTLGQRNFAG